MQRLLHMLVLEEYLRETLIFVRDIPLAYLKIGTQVDKLMNGQKRIEFAIENVKAKKGKKTDVNLKEAGPSSATNEAIKAIQEKCYDDLVQKCRDTAQARNFTVGAVMNNEALKIMAKTMPATQEEMMEIPHVTKANYATIGHELLEIIKDHAAEMAMVRLDMDAIQNESGEFPNESDISNDGTNWSGLGAAGANSSGTGGRKRKRGFGSFRRKKGTARKATPKKRRTAAKKTTKTATARTARAGGPSKVTLLKPRVFN